MSFVRFRLPRARNPLARLLFAVVGIVVLGGIFLFGLFAALALLLIGGVSYLLRQLATGSGAPGPRAQTRPEPAPDGVLEGEFVVIREPASRLPR